MANNRSLNTFARINGKSIPLIGWQCHLTSYGNLCTFEVTTSAKQLKTSYPAIFTDQNTTPNFECKIYLSDSAAGSDTIVFDGIVDMIDGTWEDDFIEISGRDYSAILRDTSSKLDTYLNANVSQVVKGICSDPQVNIQSVIKVGDDQKSGIQVSSFEGVDWSFSVNPKPNWNIIQELAEAVDCVAFVDRLKTLHFVAPGSGGSDHQFYWRPAPPQQGQEQTQEPILHLSITQQSQRCNNFLLYVHGYDRSGKQTIYGTKTVGAGGRVIHKSRQDVNSINLDSIMNSIASEIQRKNTVAKLVVEGNLNLNVNDTVTINEVEAADLLGLSGRNLFIVSVVHSFSMPDYGADEGDGFLTHLTCNQADSGNS